MHGFNQKLYGQRHGRSWQNKKSKNYTNGFAPHQQIYSLLYIRGPFCVCSRIFHPNFLVIFLFEWSHPRDTHTSRNRHREKQSWLSSNKSAWTALRACVVCPCLTRSTVASTTVDFALADSPKSTTKKQPNQINSFWDRNARCHNFKISFK